MSRLGSYQTAAARCGTVIERADPQCPPLFGGGVTKHPLARTVAAGLIRELNQLGAEAKVRESRDPDDPDRVFVYLAGCSFHKTDLLRVSGGTR